MIGIHVKARRRVGMQPPALWCGLRLQHVPIRCYRRHAAAAGTPPRMSVQVDMYSYCPRVATLL